MSTMNETDDLIISYLCDDLRPGLEETLGQLLVRDPAVRSRFTMLARQTVLLRKVFLARAQDPSVESERPRKRFRFPFRVTLAAAAGIAAVIGATLLFLRPSVQDDRPYVIVRQEGAVQLGSNTVETAADGYCLLRYRDGSTVALNRNTRLALAETEGKTLTLPGGYIFVDTVKQDHPMVVRTPVAQCRVIGTRFWVAQKGTTTLGVIEGSVRMSIPGTAVDIHPGQIGRGPVPIGNNKGIVIEPSSEESSPRWLNEAGVDAEPVFASLDRAGATLPRMTNGLDVTTYRVEGGRWIVDPRKGTYRQDSPAPNAALVFTGKRWRSGVLSNRFRVLDLKGGRPMVAIIFESDFGWDTFGLSKQLSVLTPEHNWIVMKMQFEVAPDGYVLSRLELWPEDDRSKIKVFNWRSGPSNTRIRQPRGSGRLGLLTSNCAVEFRDLRMIGRPAD